MKITMGEGAGALQSPVQVVVDGAPPAGTMIPLLRPSRLRRVRPPIPLLWFRPQQIRPGAHLTTRGVRLTIPGAHPTIPGVHPDGALQTTLGGPPTKPHRTKLPMKPILTRGRGRDGRVTSRTAVGRAGATHPTPRPSLARTRPEEDGEIPPRPPLRPSVSPRVSTGVNLIDHATSFYFRSTKNGALT